MPSTLHRAMLVATFALAVTACASDDDSASTTEATPATTESATDVATTGPATVPPTTASATTVPETTAPETTAPETTAPPTTTPETTAPETTAPETTAADTTVPDTTVPPLDGALVFNGSLAANESTRIEIPITDEQTIRFRVTGSSEADLVAVMLVDEESFVTGLYEHPTLVAQVGFGDDLTYDELLAESRDAELLGLPGDVFPPERVVDVRDGEGVIDRVDSQGEGDTEASFALGLGAGPITMVLYEYDGEAAEYEVIVEYGPDIDFDSVLGLAILETDPFFTDERFSS